MSDEQGVTASGGTAAGRRVRMLLADDDDNVRFLLRQLLEDAGPYEVAVASDGQEAVDTALRVHPEVAVLDLAMPRMSGLEAASELRRLLPDCRIVIHSSYSAAMMGQQAIDAGADVYVEKRVRPDHLLDALAGLLPSREVLPAAAPWPATPSQEHTPVRSREDVLLEALNPHVGVVFTDAAGRVTAANSAATSLLGVPAHEIAGWALADQLSASEPMADQDNPLVAALTTGTSRSEVELDLVRPDGSRTRLSVSVRPVLDPGDSRPSGAVAVLRDLTVDTSQDHRSPY